MQSSELRSLLEKYIDHSISAEEFQQLWKTLDEARFDADWQDAIEKVLADKNLQGLSNPEQAGERLTRIRALIAAAPATPDSAIATSTPLIRFTRHRIIRRAAAAILLLTAGAYLLARHAHETTAPVVAKPALTPDLIKPGTQTAMLTLADGTTIVLDSLANGKIAQQGSTRVLKLANGQIRYQAGAKEDDKIVYNTMTTPRGGQYQLTLPDGSNIWLNAASSVTYPTAFTGNSRKIKITGEVYLEVAKDKDKPFVLTAGDQEIEVLGTRFNVNAYSDEDHIKTSLAEGSVRVNKSLLRPGQSFTNGKIETTDIDQDLAWKNGVFNFNNQSLTEVMRQLARWYNLEVVYPQGVPRKEYGGEMGRNLTLDQVLKGLENSGIHFQMDGRRIMVKP